MSSNRPQRSGRINYQVLNSTGERLFTDPIPLSTEIQQAEQEELQRSELELSIKLDQLSINEMPTSESLIETNLIIDDIRDTIDENPIHPDYASSLQSVTDKLCSLRTSLRRHEQLIKAEGHHHLSESISSTLNDIKDYIKLAKDCKTKVELADKKQATEASILKERSTYFAIEDIQYKIGELQKIFNCEIS